MTAANYDRAFPLVLVHEGGYVNNPKDPGGATNLGITIATLRAYRGRATSIADVKNLTKAEAGAIYRQNYWDAVKGDRLPSGVDYAVFDFGVNSGVSRAAKFLQMCLHVEPDGHIGSLTINAAQTADAKSLINALCDRRLAFLKALPTWSEFGKGWTSRVAGVRKEALAMAALPQTHDQPVLVPAEPKPPPTLPPRQPPDFEPPQPAPEAGFFARLIKWLSGVK